MHISAVILVVVSAFLHASWNLIAKQNRGNYLFFWQALIATVLLFLAPFIVLVSQNPIPTDAWVWIVMTGVLHTLYFSTLATAYRRADLSVVYPIARGLAPVLVLIISVSVLRESVTPLGVSGVLVVVIGVYTINIRVPKLSAWLTPIAVLFRSKGRYAVATGILIAAYTIVDKQGVSLVHPLVYVYLLFAASALGVTATLVTHRPIWNPILDLHQWGRATGMAILWVSAYGLVLFALQIAPTAYVAAMRETGIVIGAALGILAMREIGGYIRIIGAGIVACGVGMIALS
jgi:drug/metabolite transporter (DMT)-like permease